MTLLNLPNEELQRMIGKMATELKSVKDELATAREQLITQEWALQIAKDEAFVNAQLLQQRQLKVVGAV